MKQSTLAAKMHPGPTSYSTVHEIKKINKVKRVVQISEMCTMVLNKNEYKYEYTVL